jgi:hypothetical protein
MKYFAYISLFVCILLACKQTDIQPMASAEKATFLGEWRYVGRFSHSADYRCTVCPEFDYEKSIYKVTFKEDNTFDVRINLLLGKGNYVVKSDTKSTPANAYGTIDITDFQILNKPFETEEDTEFQQRFRDINFFSHNTKANNTFGYDELNLNLKTSNLSEYLLFVKKK